MKKDIKRLRDYKEIVTQKLMSRLGVTHNEATLLLKCFEEEDVFRIKAPDAVDRPAEHLYVDKTHAARLKSVDRKLGNIVINAHNDWRSIAVTALAAIASFSGTPFFVIIGVLGALLSASQLAEFHLDETNTAIILALQNHSTYGTYGADEAVCFQDTNRILLEYKYAELSFPDFQRAIDELIKYGCIEQTNGFLKLKEKITVQY